MSGQASKYLDRIDFIFDTASFPLTPEQIAVESSQSEFINLFLRLTLVETAITMFGRRMSAFFPV